MISLPKLVKKFVKNKFARKPSHLRVKIPTYITDNGNNRSPPSYKTDVASIFEQLIPSVDRWQTFIKNYKESDVIILK